MQLVRTLTDRRERTFARKAREVLLALMMRRWFGAQHVLNRYLEIAYTGTNLIGLEDASHSLFNKPIANCSVRQKAILSALLVSPAPAFRSLKWWSGAYMWSEIALSCRELVVSRRTNLEVTIRHRCGRQGNRALSSNKPRTGRENRGSAVGSACSDPCAARRGSFVQVIPLRIRWVLPKPTE